MTDRLAALESNLDDIASHVLAMVAARSPGADAEVTAAHGRRSLTRFANSFIHQNVADESRSVTLNVVVGGRQSAVTTDRTDQSGIESLVDVALESAALRPVDPGWPGPAPLHDVPTVEHYDPETAASTPSDRAAGVKAFVDSGKGELVAAGYLDTEGSAVAFANSRGHRARGRWSRATIEAIHYLTEPAGGGGRGPAGRGWQSSVTIADIDAGAVGATAAAKARAGIDPVELEPGRYEVILEPACVADVLDFLVFYGANAKMHAEGQSWMRLGEAQLDPTITIWDDACDPRSVGLLFDSEGTAKSRLDLVVEGVSANLAHDRRTAMAAGAGVSSTAHAFPGSERWGPICTNLFVEAGSQSPEEMIASVGRGLLVTELWYTRILDPKTQVVTGLTRNGTFLIEHGEIVGAVKDLRFTQSYVDALAPGNVLGVGHDARLFGGHAHVPSLHLASWNFSGLAGGDPADT